MDFVAVLTGTTEREEFMNYEYVSIEELNEMYEMME